MTPTASERWKHAIRAAAWRLLRAVTAAHARVSKAIARPRPDVRSRPDDVRKICLFAAISNRDNPHVPGLGDMISKNAFLKVLRDTYPSATLHCVAGPGLLRRYRNFLLQHGYIDEVVECPESRDSSVAHWFAFVRRMRAARFDLCVIDPSSVALRGIHAYLCGVPERAGVPLDPFETLFLNRIVALDYASPERFPDLLDSTLAFAAAVGVQRTLQAQDFARCFPYVAAETRGTASALTVAVHVGGDAHWNRRWPLAHYRELCARLCRIEGVGVVLVGGDCESAEIRALRASVADADPAADISDVSGGTLNAMAAQLDRAGLFVGNDSAPMHIAAALGKPVVVQCGPVGPELWQRMYAARVVRAGHACSLPSEFSSQRHELRRFSCAEFHCPYTYDPHDPKYPKCLTDIGVDHVLEVVQECLATPRSRVAAGSSGD